MCCDGHPSELLKGKVAALKAVELDDELAEGHSALASLIYSYDWNWAEAEKEFLRALELDPNSSMSHFLYADFLGRMGRRQEASVEGERARELSRLSHSSTLMEQVGTLRRRWNESGSLSTSIPISIFPIRLLPEYIVRGRCTLKL